MKKIVCLFVCLFAGATNASVITLNSIDNGWYRQIGFHNKTNTNTWTGTNGNGTYSNSFYNFDVSALAGSSIASVELTFLSNNGKYESTDSFETLQIWDVNTTPGLGSSTAVYNDLMSGVKYGQVNVSGSYYQSMPEINISLSSLSFNDILADNFFSVGAHISTLAPSYYQALWSSSYSMPAAQLTVEYTAKAVPEPASLALLGLGLAGLSFSRRKSKP